MPRSTLTLLLALTLGTAAWAEPMGPPAHLAGNGNGPAAGVVTGPTPDSELAHAEAFLYSGYFKADVINYVRFFTTYAVPEKYRFRKQEVPLREYCENALPFVLNSVSSVDAEGFIERPKRVPASDTLWWVDIRDFGWHEEDVDAVFRLQPYLLTPVVAGKNPNILFRADWFIVNATDVTKQEDRGLKARDFPYYVLQYHLGHEPKTKDDFFKAWQIDEEKAEKFRLETGTVVDKGDSGVSQHTRQLRRLRTVLGYAWYTKDVKSHDVDPDKVQSRDYVEDLFARQADAGEYISSNRRGLQTYLLSAGNNQNFAVVSFGDPTIVIDRQDLADTRVRTGKSCIVCHALGVIPYTSVIADLFKLGGDVLAQYDDVKRELKAFYRRYKNGEEVEQDNALFEQAVKECNGLDPLENMKQYLAVYEWYWNEKVTPTQAALELGVAADALKAGLKRATTGRLVLLYHDKPMPRDIWDSVNLGGYIQAALLLKVLDVETTPVGPKGGEQAPLKPARPKKPAIPPARPADAPPVQAEHPRPRPPAPGAPPPPRPPAGPSEVWTLNPQTVLLDEESRPVVYLTGRHLLYVVRDHDADWYFVKTGKWEGYVKKAVTGPAR